MVLSPQCFHNLNLHSDIFNHSNVHFWEYMQPGYDTLGFISCTGKLLCMTVCSPIHLLPPPPQLCSMLVQPIVVKPSPIYAEDALYSCKFGCSEQLIAVFVLNVSDMVRLRAIHASMLRFRQILVMSAPAAT